MPKMTIYVADDLKAAMDKVEDQKPNWSGIAQIAFQAEAERLSTRKRGAGKMDAVIERLRASKQRVESEERTAGYESGRKWAMEDAEFAELKRLSESRHVTILGGGIWIVIGRQIFDFQGGGSLTKEAREEIEVFWEEWAQIGAPSDDFVKAFVEGALSVYDDVADKL